MARVTTLTLLTLLSLLALVVLLALMAISTPLVLPSNRPNGYPCVCDDVALWLDSPRALQPHGPIYLWPYSPLWPSWLYKLWWPYPLALLALLVL